MGSMIFFELLKGVILILIVDLLGGQSRERVISIKSFITVVIIASLYYLSNIDGLNWLRNILPFAIMSVMALHVLLIGIGYDLKRYVKIIISAYIITMLGSGRIDHSESERNSQSELNRISQCTLAN